MIFDRHLLALLAMTLTTGCGAAGEPFELGGYRYRTDGLTQWSLPPELREVSGLALDARGRLFAHGDEKAVIFQIDYRAGRTVKRFALGDPPVEGDFEGLAWADDRFYLVTSDGDLLIAGEGEDGSHVTYERQRTRLGRRCEIEGLHHQPEGNLLLMPCKTPREPGLEDRVAVLAWSLDTAAAAPEGTVEAPVPGGAGAINPSGLTRAPANGNLILVAARQRALLELDPHGTLTRAFVLPSSSRHPQMEGVVMTPSGDLVIADEGGAGGGRLSVYAALD